MWKKILIALAAVLVLVVGVVAMQPDEFHVERSATISAPASEVFALVNDFRKWNDWSPWDKMDPSMKRSYEGPTAGQGARYAWVGDSNNVGEGSMTIVESQPHELVHIRLDFTRPVASTHDVRFTFKPEGNATKVTWSMDGKKNLMCKAFCLLTSMDQMVGSEYEKGLAAMKSIAESTAARSTP